MKYLIKNNINGIISYKDKYITNYIIVDKIDPELEFLRDKKLITIEKYIENTYKKDNKINYSNDEIELNNETNFNNEINLFEKKQKKIGGKNV